MMTMKIITNTSYKAMVEYRATRKFKRNCYILFISDKEKQHYNKSLVLKGLVPAVSSARDQDFSAKLENKAARHQILALPEPAVMNYLPIVL
eukprot:13186187-Ditylum_brightwellii.AAC.1